MRRRKETVKRSVVLRLGAFASRALTARPENDSLHGDDEPAGNDVLRAVRFYLSEKNTDAASWPYAPFLRERQPGKEVEIELEIDDSLWRALEDEAANQGVPVERLMEHAAFYYAAELDAGRVTKLILDPLDEG